MTMLVRAIVAGGLALALAGCSSGAAVRPEPAGAAPSGAPSTSASPAGTSAPATVPALADTVVRVPAGSGAAPFDQTQRLQAPPGWTVSVWARVPGARLLAWAPDGRLLVSRPRSGDVVELSPGQGPADAPPTRRTLVTGLDQPHGLAFSGNTLYVAESDRVDAFTYAAGAVSGKRVVVDGLPNAKSPELGGAYAHALKSVAVGRDGALYVSVGSTGNISAQDRDADPQRASILRVAPGGGAPTVFARGVRNGTGLAVDPDGGVWTAVNNRDNIEYPGDTDYDGDGEADAGRVIQAYVNDHPLEPLAKLQQGRDLGWPYCNPDPDVAPGRQDSPLSYTLRPFLRDVQTNPDGTKLDCAALPPVEQGMGAHSRRPPGSAGRTVPAPSSASTVRGTAPRPGPRRSPSSPGATARSARSRRS